MAKSRRKRVSIARRVVIDTTSQAKRIMIGAAERAKRVMIKLRATSVNNRRLGELVNQRFIGCKLLGHVEHPFLKGETSVFSLGDDFSGYVGVIEPDGAAMVKPWGSYIARRKLQPAGAVSRRRLDKWRQCAKEANDQLRLIRYGSNYGGTYRSVAFDDEDNRKNDWRHQLDAILKTLSKYRRRVIIHEPTEGKKGKKAKTSKNTAGVHRKRIRAARSKSRSRKRVEIAK